MYGFVNQAARDLIVKRHGAQTWDEIRNAADIEEDLFVSDAVYDDAITYRIVQAVADRLKITVPEVLETFGEHWVSFVESNGYGGLLRANGRTLKEFLSNLDQLHGRLTATYPHFSPPSFRFEEKSEELIAIDYISTRPGLAPMVAGILRAVANRYETPVEVSVTESGQGAQITIRLKTAVSADTVSL